MLGSLAMTVKSAKPLGVEPLNVGTPPGVAASVMVPPHVMLLAPPVPAGGLQPALFRNVQVAVGAAVGHNAILSVIPVPAGLSYMALGAFPPGHAAAAVLMSW